MTTQNSNLSIFHVSRIINYLFKKENHFTLISVFEYFSRFEGQPGLFPVCFSNFPHIESIEIRRKIP